MKTKRKSASHIIDKEAIQIVKMKMPKEWEVREYAADYGIDLSIELFKEVEEHKHEMYETLGEHFYVQVKGTRSIKESTFKMYSRNNIEKEVLKKSETYKDIDVIKFSLETSELNTINRMGTITPVLLFLVDVTTKDIYFLCLNDYIDKVLFPEDPVYFEKEHKTIYVPKTNLITSDKASLSPLLLYAKRPKHYSFFNKVKYQTKELTYTSEDELISQCKYFATILLRFDIWNNPILNILQHQFKELTHLVNDEPLEGWLTTEAGTKSLFNDESTFTTRFSNDTSYNYRQVKVFTEIRILWQNMSSVGDVYEEVIREFYLPTSLNDLYT